MAAVPTVVRSAVRPLPAGRPPSSGRPAPTALDRRDLERCAAGDPEAFEALYQRHARSCLLHARQVLVDPQLAEDAVQEAFLDLWRQAARYDGRTTVRSWLLMLTHRRSVDRVRSEERQRTVALGDEHAQRADGRPGPDVQAVLALLGEDALRSLAGLTRVKREALVLAYWGGYTQAEIAVLVGAPLGTVKTRVLAALRELRATLVPEQTATG